ncbi:M48 family metallopeptidase [Prauserella cavernicola]|uniref:M48 family metallopeptidase n=1 Tax=Prauserella cavernicola TaxID=2800127 RepID=A0A934QRC8_9PSEU|nr:M48 family metallopeptidase [Prauserella cavernicola]MBK1784279.1 M48 family metallopeptidase [Prauserella cavernicola]
MRGSVRGGLAVLSLVLFPVVVLAPGLGGVLAGVAIGHRTGLVVAILSLAALLVLGLALVRALRTRLPAPKGPALTRQAHPALWRLVDELAARARTRPPDVIVLVGEVEAAVRDDARVLGLRQGRRYLVIGLPLLAGLDVAELRCVLAHELGHYAGARPGLLAVSYRGAETLRLIVSRVDRGPTRWILGAYAWVYAVVSRSPNRAQELRADEYSVAAAGRAIATSALRKTTTLRPLWQSYGDRFLRLPPLAERTPDVLLGFRLFLGHPAQRRLVTELEPTALGTRPGSRFDGHRSARQRIERIATLPEAPARPDPRPAWTVLTDPARTIPVAEERLYFKAEPGPRTTWGEIVQLSGATSATRGAALLARAGRESGVAPNGTLGELLTAVQHGRIDRLMRPLLDESADPELLRHSARERLAVLLGDVVVCALLAQRRVHHELDWGRGWVVTGPEGVLDVARLVTPAVRDPESVPRLAQRLTVMGVPLDFGRGSAGSHGEVGRMHVVVGVAPEVVAFKRNWDVLIHDDGLLLVPLTASRHLAGAVGRSESARRKRIARLLRHGTAQLIDRPGARWLPMATMLGGERKSYLTGGGKVALRFAGGDTATLRTQDDDAYDELARFLDTVPRPQGAAR